VIENKHFFVKGLIQIPVVDMNETFGWGVWVSLSEKNFRRLTELQGDAYLLDEPPYFGWLSSRIPGYPDTLNLKTNVHFCKLGDRPHIELEPTDHPLAVEQRSGITRARAIELAQLVMHNRE